MNKKITNSQRWRFLAIVAALYLGAFILLYFTVPAHKRHGLIVLMLSALPFALIGLAGGVALIMLLGGLRSGPSPKTTVTKQRPGMGLAYSVCMVSVSFILTPFLLHAEVPKMPGFVFWYLVATGFLGLLGLVWLFVWFKKSSD